MAKQIKKFDKKTAFELLDAINEALKPVAAKYGLSSIKGLNRLTNAGDTLNIKVEAKLQPNAETVKANETMNETISVALGFKSNIVGKKFTTFDETQYEITELKPSRPSYPIIAKEKRTGKSYKFSANSVQAYLGFGS